MIRHNLSPESARWGRNVERRIAQLETSLGVRQGARAGDVRRDVRGAQSQPQVFTEVVQLSAPEEEIVATWDHAVPEGAKSAWVTGLFTSDYGLSEGVTTSGNWYFFLGGAPPDPDWVHDPRSSSGLLLGLDLYPPAPPYDWQVTQDIPPGGFADVENRDLLTITCLSNLPSVPTSDVILRVDLTYVILWSFERVSQWGA